ncbi:MAG: N-6 DNA methylase [Leptolyngbya sp. SIO1D8]|nr:N-6 DNA methylase [Leptolyngbya sp. SIO1D8]
MTTNPLLYCPIRGQLKVRAKAKNNLKFTEEKRRIDCIKFLLGKGYPKENFKIETTLVKFGNKGRNSFRTDLVIFDVSAEEVEQLSLELLREHILIAAEIKRDNKTASEAKETQVKPALNWLSDLRSLALYWDDIEQKVFYKSIQGNKQRIIEAPLAYLPDYGSSIEVVKLRYADLRISPNLLDLFKKVEDSLHHYCADRSERYQVLLQILLAKIYDENSHKYVSDTLAIQDFSVLGYSDQEIVEIFNKTLKSSLEIYQFYLPPSKASGRPSAPDEFYISGAALRDISSTIASVNMLESSPEVIQNFYMYFAKEIYKWDLAQYFTPYEVIDFIVKIANPHFGDTIKDPACGSADFLVSAYRMGVRQDPKIGDRVWGSDNSRNAVEISVLNMLLNGDGKSNIKEEDSLANILQYENQYTIMLCNPPFGTKIKEKRSEVLMHFDLGKQVLFADTELENEKRKEKKVKYQESGILFVELCVRQARPGGRIAIIVPNGYLGNRSQRYKSLREWILRHTKIACVVGFPRFTFKKSGADVSASVLILEKRNKPLSEPSQTEDYPVYFNLVDSVGWDITKKAKKLYRRDSQTGEFLLNEENEPILDATFEEVLADLYRSPVIDAFPWIARGIEGAGVNDGWSVSIKTITRNSDLIIDPKRWCRKYYELISRIQLGSHSSLLEICDLIEERRGFKKQKSSIYKYVEIQDINGNSYDYKLLKGWELPSRARHLAQKGDIFLGSIWSSVNKWFMAGKEAESGNLIVTNGFYRLQVKPNMQEWLPDLIFALSSEFYRVQMRALATGSDGLAEISPEDLRQIIIPKINDSAIRTKMQSLIQVLLEEPASLQVFATRSIQDSMQTLDVPSRPSNYAQV